MQIEKKKTQHIDHKTTEIQRRNKNKIVKNKQKGTKTSKT